MPDLNVVHSNIDSSSGIPALEDIFNQRPFEAMTKAFSKAFEDHQLATFHETDKARSTIRKAYRWFRAMGGKKP